ncbi:MAG: GNAT family N-acetyltransferase [Novosphingobium sp.]
MTMMMQTVPGASATGQDRRCRFAPFGTDPAVARAWARLEGSARLPTQSQAFIAALSRTMLAGARIAIVLAPGVDGGSALLPLCREKGWLARWRTAGSLEVFEPVDALYAGADGARLLAETVARQSRPLRLDRMPADSALVPALKAAMAGRGWLSVRPAQSSPLITLDEGWESPESRFNARRRSDFRRAARRAEALGVVSWEVLSPTPAEFDALFDEAIAIELRSWKKAAGTAIALDPAKEAFFRAFFRAACAEGTFRAAFLRIDGRAVAMQLALESYGRFWLFKIGYDEACGKCSPGTLLMLHTLGWAKRRGLRSYELLGESEAWIADLWTRECREHVRVRTYPFGLRGVLALAADAAAWVAARLRRAGRAA